MPKRLLFLNGPSQDMSDRFFGWPTSLLYAIAPTVQAVREGTLDMEFSPKLFDPVWYVEGLNDKQLTDEFRINVNCVDIVCASATYDSIYPTIRLLREAKSLYPQIITILGGPYIDEIHQLSQFEEVMKSSAVDYAIAGDGELALLAVLKSICNKSDNVCSFNNLPGRATVYGPHGTARTSGCALLVDELPLLPLELADGKRHRYDFDIFRNDSGIIPTVQMIAQRGCGYNCNYCSERRDLAPPNARSIDHILGEIYHRKAQGFGAVFFDDSTFGLYPKLSDLLKELAHTGMRFGCLNRFNTLLDGRLLEGYRRAGFVYFYCSIEQLDDAALRLMGKAQDEKRIRRAVGLLNEFGFKLGVSLLYGLPYETECSILRTHEFTAEWVNRGTICLVSQSILSLHPGTPVGKNLKESFCRTPPHRGYPFDRFEEGQWYHHPHVTPEYLHRILMSSEAHFGDVMVRQRHSWYAQKGYVAIPEASDLKPRLLEYSSV